ncbi:MAG: hypothetical protein IKU84_00020 [Clostridia bacterium]|nr:hypothetical protein [Clostridia bacterium]
MDNIQATFLNDEFENSMTGEKVEGITVIVDGDFKDFLYDILEKNGDKYSNVTEIVKDAMVIGLKTMID